MRRRVVILCNAGISNGAQAGSFDSLCGPCRREGLSRAELRAGSSDGASSGGTSRQSGNLQLSIKYVPNMGA